MEDAAEEFEEYILELEEELMMKLQKIIESKKNINLAHL